MRICPDCESRELEYRQKFCSECAQVRRDLNMEIYRFNYANSEKGRKKIEEYEHSEKRRQSHNARMLTDKNRAYKRELYRRNKCRQS